MRFGFVVPGTGADEERPCQALVDGVGDLVAELHRQGHEVTVEELAPSCWMLPPSGFVERALSLVDRLGGCDAVVDHTGSWATLVRHTACPFLVCAHTARRAPLDSRGRSALLDEAGLPAVDPSRFQTGAGGGGYVLADLHQDDPQEFVLDTVVHLGGETGRPERAALLAEALMYIAPHGPAGAWAAVEALACGTPVIARAGTPAAHVVTAGVTGVVVEHRVPLTDATAIAATLDRWACRHSACERFSVERRARDLAALGKAAPAVANLSTSNLASEEPLNDQRASCEPRQKAAGPSADNVARPTPSCGNAAPHGGPSSARVVFPVVATAAR